MAGRIIKRNPAFIYLNQPLFFHLTNFPHHGAAVYAEIICEGAKRKRERKGTGGLLVSRHQCETAKQLFPDGALA